MPEYIGEIDGGQIKQDLVRRKFRFQFNCGRETARKRYHLIYGTFGGGALLWYKVHWRFLVWIILLQAAPSTGISSQTQLQGTSPGSWIRSKQVCLFDSFFIQNTLLSLFLLNVSQILIMVKAEPNLGPYIWLPLQHLHRCLKLKYNPLPPVLLWNPAIFWCPPKE